MKTTEETKQIIMAIISDAVTLKRIGAITEKRIEIALSQHSANVPVSGKKLFQKSKNKKEKFLALPFICEDEAHSEDKCSNQCEHCKNTYRQ